jgi:predicted nucleic acid-binding protein
VSKEPAFWDASALVPLCVHENSSRQAQSHLRQSMPVVWWASPVEVHSAIARLHRLGKLKDVDKKGALSRLDILSRGWREILPSDTLRELSTRLVETYELRAADPAGRRVNLVSTTARTQNFHLCGSTPV